MIGFTLIPLGLIFYYGMTDKTGAFTLANVLSIATAEHAKALWLSLGISFLATCLCLLLAYPLAMILRAKGVGASGFIVFIFILPMWMNFPFREERRDQRDLVRPPSASPEPDQHAGGDHLRHGL